MTSLPQPHDAQPSGSLTVAGAAMRDTAVQALARRHAVLLERSKARLLTGAERTELNRLGVVIDTLQGMG